MAKKCKQGFRNVGNKCVRIAQRVARDFINQSNRNVRYIIIATSIILAFLFVVNPDIRVPVGINLIFLGISYFIYSSREYQDDLIGIPNFFSINTLIAIGFGIIFTVGFFVVTAFIPFFSLAFPQLPSSIGSKLQWFFIVIIAPITETCFFMGAIYAFFRNFNPRYKWIWILLLSLVFSLFHLGAIIFGFYTLNPAEGLIEFTNNISAFSTAFLFSIVAMIFALRRGIQKANWMFIAVFHLGLNFISFSLSVISFIK